MGMVDSDSDEVIGWLGLYGIGLDGGQCNAIAM
jgi:hypothetical protein